MLFSGGAKDQGGASGTPAVVDSAQSNRILLILAGVLVLLIFMDFQARRHYSALAESYGTNETAAARKRLNSAADSLGEPIQVQARELLGAGVDQSIEIVEETTNAGRDAQDTIGDVLEENLNEDNLREVVNGDLVRSRNLNPDEVPAKPTAIVQPPEFVYLYFIRFRNSKSELVRVRRPPSSFRLTADGRLNLAEVIAALKQGPGTREAGLINAVDRGLEIKSIRLNAENGLLELDVNERIGRLGKHVIRDRLDQLAFTLTQFSEVGGVRLLVNGKPVQTIGSQGFVVPAILRPTDRIYHNYK